jgi:hypothetical protein
VSDGGTEFKSGDRVRFRKLSGRQEGTLYELDFWNRNELRFDWAVMFEVDDRPHFIAAKSEELEAAP